jgi:hypothetical protein
MRCCCGLERLYCSLRLGLEVRPGDRHALGVLGRRGDPMASLPEEAFRRYEFYNPGAIFRAEEGDLLMRAILQRLEEDGQGSA